MASGGPEAAATVNKDEAEGLCNVLCSFEKPPLVSPFKNFLLKVKHLLRPNHQLSLSLRTTSSLPAEPKIA